MAPERLKPSTEISSDLLSLYWKLLVERGGRKVSAMFSQVTVTQSEGNTKTMAILPLKSYPTRALALSVLEVCPSASTDPHGGSRTIRVF